MVNVEIRHPRDMMFNMMEAVMRHRAVDESVLKEAIDTCPFGPKELLKGIEHEIEKLVKAWKRDVSRDFFQRDQELPEHLSNMSRDLAASAIIYAAVLGDPEQAMKDLHRVNDEAWRGV